MSPSPPFDLHPIDDLAVYALDALDGPERAALERHLAGCPACRAELDALRATAAHLVRPTAPPAHLWRSISAALTPAPAAPGSAHDHPRPSAAPGTRAADGFPPAPAQDGRRRHPSLDRGRGRSTGTGRAPGPGRRRFAGVLAAAAAVAVVAGALGFLSGRAGEQARSTDVAAVAESALADPGNVQVSLTDGDGAEVARVVVDDSSGYVVLDGLPPLPAGRAYQLWDLDGTTPVSLGVLGDGTVAALAVPLPRETARLAITAEPAGGGAMPTGPVVARGLLPAPA